MSSALRKDLEDLDITKDELNCIGEALKKEEFRNLFRDYVKEITDPENKKKYEEEITQLEKERGVDITFVHPSPGYVIKTSVDGQKKAFINICHNDKIGMPSSFRRVESGTHGYQWSIPYCQSQPREDLDKSNKMCVVYDIVFHPDTLRLASTNDSFKTLVNDTAVAAVEDSFKVSLDKNNLKYPKMDYKGMKHSSVIRKKSCTYGQYGVHSSENNPIFEIPNYPYPPLSEEITKTAADKEAKPRKRDVPSNPYTIPKFIIKHRRDIDMEEYTNSMTSKAYAATPKDLLIEIDLPLLKSASDLILDVTQRSISLFSEKPAMYKLNINLPYSINEDSGNAEFDKHTKKLTVTLPVRRCVENKPCTSLSRDDSGVDSESGSHSNESASDEDVTGVREIKQDVVVLGPNSAENCEHGEAFRTSLVGDTRFLKQDVHYSLPSFTANVCGNVIAFTIHVRNVEPSSIQHVFLEKSSGFHLQFLSMGTGFFPIHYAFCASFPSIVRIDCETLNVDVWDNNIIAQVKLIACDLSMLTEYYIGVDVDKLAANIIPEPLSFAKTICDSKARQECEQQETNSGVVVTALEAAGTDSVVLEISLPPPTRSGEQFVEEERSSGLSSSSRSPSSSPPPPPPPTTVSPKQRTQSESDKAPAKSRGILKLGRSLSESSLDDYSAISSQDVFDCIPEDQPCETKKTVRFSEVIFEKTFRANSSILGQRKKNQRKMRNKRRAAKERRASESEASESEASRSGGDTSETSESEGDSGGERREEAAARVCTGPKGHRRGGKKSARKQAAYNKSDMALCSGED